MDGTTVKILEVADTGPETVALAIETPPGFDARPGQFVQVGKELAGESVTRHYTVSSPRVTDEFELTVGVDSEGTLSPWLAEARPGDTVEVAGPFGRVYYEDEPSVIALASGPGIGAALAVAERALLDGSEATLAYLADHREDRDERGALVHEKRLSGLALGDGDCYVVETEERFHELVTALAGSGQVFAYGFEPFVEDVHEALRAAGRDPYEAKLENFG